MKEISPFGGKANNIQYIIPNFGVLLGVYHGISLFDLTQDDPQTVRQWL